MKVYMVRHGTPKTEAEDAARPLSGAGRREVASMGTFLASGGAAPSAIRHSGKLRAGQTAEILAEALSPPQGCAPAEGLAPLDDPSLWRGRLEREEQDLMLVGHLPHLDRLSSALLGAGNAGGVVSFEAGTAACCERTGDGSWTLLWLVPPSMLHGGP